MKACAFVGQSFIFDNDIKNKISEAVKEILLTDDEFIFYYINENEFDKICCSVIIETQSLFSKKSIRLIGVVNNKEREFDTKTNTCEYVYPLEKYSGGKLTNHKLAVKWMMQQCDILFLYCYPAFYGLEYYYIEYAQLNPNLKIISLLNQKTEVIMQEIIETLTNKMQNILYKHNEGHTYKEIANMLDIKATGIRATYRHCHAIIRRGFRNYWEKNKSDQMEKGRHI